MAGGKLSARQKMINMMYLVLTALLALNVSKEIIKAFNLIENSLDNSTRNIVQKNNAVLSALQKTASQDNQAAKVAVEKVNEAQKISEALIKKIGQIKTDLLTLSGDGKDPKTGRKSDEEGQLVKGGVNELAQGDNMEIHANYFVAEDNGKRGTELQKAINDTRKALLGVLESATNDTGLAKNPETVKFLLDKMKAIEAKTSLYAEDGTNSSGSKQTWVSMYLEHSPLAGVFAMLSKIENDCRSLEAEVAQALAESVNAADYKFDSLIPVVSSPMSAVLTGQTYEANILLAAYNSKAQMRVLVNGNPIDVVAGVGKYKVTPQSPGSSKYKVGIEVPTPGGGSKLYETEAEYSVFAPQAAISADKMNVFYVGLPNELSVSVGGVDPKNVMVRVSGGGASLASGPGGKYLVRIAAYSQPTCQIQVAAKLPDGRVVPMGNKTFRIKTVPRPTFQAGTVVFRGSSVSRTALSAQNSARAVLDGFVFEDVSFKIVGYRFICVGRRTNGPQKKEVGGSSLAPIKGFLSKLGPGDFVQFDNIRAVGPDGKTIILDNASGNLQ
ncbi:MAG: gliding motility protein GldM [Bacteroidetes bacterium]|nr:gliding motility protein GldM [Bacteroidota bacterium]MDA0943901.1 gliding motility protein GldM [Bacteroidota bacterium]MDA1112082.1 gliding motility protein GldM [Bacteroidota bacterium]